MFFLYWTHACLQILAGQITQSTAFTATLFPPSCHAKSDKKKTFKTSQSLNPFDLCPSNIINWIQGPILSNLVKDTGSLLLVFDLSSQRNNFQTLSAEWLWAAHRISTHQRDLFFKLLWTAVSGRELWCLELMMSWVSSHSLQRSGCCGLMTVTVGWVKNSCHRHNQRVSSFYQPAARGRHFFPGDRINGWMRCGAGTRCLQFNSWIRIFLNPWHQEMWFSWCLGLMLW